MRSFYGTSNALSEIVATFRGVTVALDELALNSGSSHALESWLYAVCTGSSKQRLSGDANLKAVKDFSTVLVTTGEYPLLNNDTQGGLYARCFEISDDLTSDARNSEAIKSTVLNNYALAAPVFVSYLLDTGVDEIYKLYNIVVAKLQSMVKVKSGLRERAISKLAMVIVAAHLVNGCFGFKINGTKFNNYVVKLIESSIIKLNPEEQLLNAVREEVAAIRTRFCVNDNPPFGGCIGKIIENKGYNDVYIAQREFESLMDKHKILGFTRTLKNLKKEGILFTEGDRLTKRVKLGTTKVVCYGFRLVETDDDNSTSDE